MNKLSNWIEWRVWYDKLNKPSWTPAPSVISTIWSILYPIIALTYFYVLYKTINKKMHWKVLLVLTINLIANLIFTPIQFGFKNLPLASLDILIVWITIIIAMIFLWKYSKIFSLLQIPYLAWVSIASAAQFVITVSN